MDVTQLIDQLAADGPLLALAAGRAGWDAPVPGTRWDVRELVTHVGGIHRWAADIVRTCGTKPDTEAGRAVGTGPGDDALLDWFVDGHTALVVALGDAPAGLQAFTFLPSPSPLEFWARRQAHETAIHRVDAEGAAGAVVTPFAAEFAQDGIEEMLHGFAARKRKAIDRSATLALQPSDGAAPRLITFREDRISVAEQDGTQADSALDAAVSGTSSDLYRWLWNRPVGVDVTGDQAVAELWRAVQVTWG